MDKIIRTGFSPITHSISFDPQKLIKGKDLALLHVQRFEEIEAVGTACIIRCSVVRTTSVTEHPYKVQLELDNNRHVKHATCSCVAGSAHKCKHIYALIYYVNRDRSESKTSFEQQWGKPTDSQLGKDIYAKPLVISNVYKKPDIRCNPVHPYDLKFSDVCLVNCPLRTVLKYEDANEDTVIVRQIIKDILSQVVHKSIMTNLEACANILICLSTSSDMKFESICIVNEKYKKIYIDNIKLSEKVIIEKCIQTVMQSENEEWFKMRLIRITASSKAHFIKTRSKKSEEQLADQFIKKGDESLMSQSVKYGIKHENDAVKEYSTKYNKKVVHVGSLVMPQQEWLCVSADGVVVEDCCITKVLEIKCPFSCANKPIFDNTTNSFNVPYMYYDEKVIHLNKSHKYYTQVQVLLYATGVTECDFYVWSPKGSCLINIPRDDDFLYQIIPKLQKFYVNFFLPKMYDQMEKENQKIIQLNPQGKFNFNKFFVDLII